MKKLLTPLAALSLTASTAYAQSFDPNNGTGNIVLSLGSKPTAPLSHKITVRRSRVRGYAMVPRTRWFT